MKKINIYSMKMQTIIRSISLFAIIILVVSNTNRVLRFRFENLISNHFELLTFVINCLSIFLFFMLVIFPTKIEIISFISFLYGSLILIFEPQNNIGILMYFLSLISLYARGVFNKQKKLIKTIFFVFFICLLISEIRFGKEIFLKCIFEKVAYTFVFYLCLFFLQIYTFDIYETNNVNSRLDIQKFQNLKKRDAEWLVEILNGKKYEALAINYHMSLGSVKNRLKVIFDEIGVGDKQGFLNKYSDYEICYGDDFSSI